MHAMHRALDQRKAHPVINVLDVKGPMLKENDMRPFLCLVIQKPEKIESGISCLCAKRFVRLSTKSERAENIKLSRPFLVKGRRHHHDYRSPTAVSESRHHR